MNRLQKKCLVGSALLHGLPAFIFLICSAFSSSRELDAPVVTFVPPSDIPLTDQGSTGPSGGAMQAPPPKAQEAKPEVAPPKPQVAEQAPPEPQPQKPEPKQEPVEEKPEPKQEPIKLKPVKSETPKVEPEKIKTEIAKTKVIEPKATTKPTQKIDLTPVKKTKPTQTSSALAAALKASEKQAADRRREQALREMASAIGGAKTGIRQNTASSTSIEPIGFGGGGAAAMNYGQYVKAKYDDAWADPDDVTDENAVVKTEIIIERDGSVVSAKIISRSGVPALDKSVETALNRVKSVRPFPEGATESRRTFILKFNLKAKRSLG